MTLKLFDGCLMCDGCGVIADFGCGREECIHRLEDMGWRLDYITEPGSDVFDFCPACRWKVGL
jgi:hypothetical protein